MQLKLTLSTASKQCTKCGVTKPLPEFPKDRSRRDGLFTWCKECARQSSADRYNNSDTAKIAHREAQRRFKARQRGDLDPHVPQSQYQMPRERLDRSMKKNTRRRLSGKLFNQAVKAVVGCQVCGEREPVAIDFHHIDPTTKGFLLSRVGRDRAIPAMIEEMTKCCCLCSNCHRKYHFGIIDLDGLQPITRRQIEQAIAFLNDAKGVQ